MATQINPRAGLPPEPDSLINVAKLVTAYYSQTPDPAQTEQRVSFGTSGHRGSSLNGSFNEWHVLAMSQAICEYRRSQGVKGPLFLGIDTHALAEPALASTLEVLAANEVHVMLAQNDEYTPTPAISHAILVYNRGRDKDLADGIVVTPSHNPPPDGGFKYNATNGGPADVDATRWIETRANEFIKSELNGVRRIAYARALRATTTHRHPYLENYVNDLASVIDMDAIGASKLKMGVDPLGGAGVHYWGRIAERYRLNLDVINTQVDATFRFMTLDWDGRIRMDPSSPYAMRKLIGLKDSYDIAFACDTDHDRHGIITRSSGLMPANYYLAVCIDYLFRNRPQWKAQAAVGKTLVCSQIIDRIAAKLGRKLYEVPVGFKWFVDGLADGSLGFGGEESAGSSFLRRDGSTWTTDKDGLAAALLSAEITAREGRDPGDIYRSYATTFGLPTTDRVEAPANAEQRKRLSMLRPEHIPSDQLAGEKIVSILSTAPGNGAPIGGIKVVAQNGWFAARPSGTESIYKIYVESFLGTDHLHRIAEEAQAIVDKAIAGP